MDSYKSQHNFFLLFTISPDLTQAHAHVQGLSNRKVIFNLYSLRPLNIHVLCSCRCPVQFNNCFIALVVTRNICIYYYGVQNIVKCCSIGR
uniref:Isoform 3 of Protein CLAVATA 3 n=1 Tax=Arabidopsis thaliana TaxID=3702 RepID=Q9XF04-3|nr:hypothetical protein [Arabidopsis thaliana]